MCIHIISPQDNGECYENMPQRQGEILGNRVENQLPKKISTPTRIQPYLRALREMLGVQYELYDRQKKEAQEVQELYDRRDVFQKLTKLLMMQKLWVKEQKEQGQALQEVQRHQEQWQDLLKLYLEALEVLRREQDLQKQQEQKLQDLCKQQEQELMELLQKQCQELLEKTESKTGTSASEKVEKGGENEVTEKHHLKK